MLQIGLGLLALALKILTSKEFLTFIDIQIKRWWDEDIPNKEKKIAVMKEAKEFFGQYSEELVSMIISAMVGSLRLQIKAQEEMQK